MMNIKNKMIMSRLGQWKVIAVGCMLLVFGLPETALSETMKGTVDGTQQAVVGRYGDCTGGIPEAYRPIWTISFGMTKLTEGRQST
ncbi:MAG: hypothetical protein LBC40_03115 [Dysgonamonadaceae bacterium]|jgi:hypothetical protein|nr:hypothetical protein [Dysgonamonadaceae bacterium]